MKETIIAGTVLLALILFSVLNEGYTPSYLDDEASAYLSLIEYNKDNSLYQNDYYVNTSKKLGIGYFYAIATYGLKKPESIEGNWGEVMEFAKTTNKDDLFVIPVFASKRYDYSSFRYLSGRSVFLEWKGTGSAVYVVDLLPLFRERFIAYCKTDFMLVKDRKDFVETCKYNYAYNMKEEDFKSLNTKYGADYLIENKQETPRKLNLPIAWENEEFVIYDLRKETKRLTV